jgi:thioesterase domain-containing protein
VTLREFLMQLQALDIKVSARGERLAVSAPNGVITRELREQLEGMKPNILAFLRSLETSGTLPPSVVSMRATGSNPPLFVVPGHNGDVFCYLPILRHLSAEQPVLALEPPGLDDGQTPIGAVPDLAVHFVDAILGVRPAGPFFLAGYCLGGVTAFEVASELRRRGHVVAFCALFGTTCPTMFWKRYVALTVLQGALVSVLQRLADKSPREIARKLVLKLAGRRPSKAPALAMSEAALRTQRLEQVTVAACRRYRPTRFDGRVTLFLPNASLEAGFGRKRDWGRFSTRGAEIVFGPPACRGSEMLREPSAAFFGPRLQAALDKAVRTS